MPASTYSGNAILDLLLRGVAPTPPSRVWVSLHTDDPGNDGANEVSIVDWPSYVRQDPADGGAIATGFLAAMEKGTVNTLDLQYAAYDGTEAITLTHFAVWTAETGGECLITGLLALAGAPAPKTLLPTDELVLRTGNLVAQVN